MLSRRSFAIALGVFGLVTACERDQPSQAPQSVDEELRWQCATDRDCMNSCAHGAVSKTWYMRNQQSLQECEDGCADQVAAPPRCESGGCVAYWEEPSSPGVIRRNQACTRKK